METNAHTGNRQRRRLVSGLAGALARKGRADLTVADVVEEAAVSRRTFYEHFENLQEAVVASHQAAASALLSLIALGCDPDRTWESQVRHGLATVLDFATTRRELAGLLVIDSFNFDRALAEHVVATRNEFASVLLPGREHYHRAGLPTITESFLVGAVASTLAPRIRSAQPEPLLELEAPLLELILMPYVGRAEAARIARSPAAET